jgi:hypothetical protein
MFGGIYRTEGGAVGSQAVAAQAQFLSIASCIPLFRQKTALRKYLLPICNPLFVKDLIRRSGREKRLPGEVLL